MIGYIQLTPYTLDLQMRTETPFAVAAENEMPCCCILGAHALTKNNIVLDFKNCNLYVEN